jgi:4-hydroxybenzoate polyprenyltransferase
MKNPAFFKLVRFPNLVIVALTQYLLQYLVLLPAIRDAGLEPILDDFHFFLLVLTTVLIAASGYIINDLLDYESDLHNKPDSVIVNRFFSKKKVEFMYYFIFVVGFAIAWYLAVYVKKLVLLQMYPAAVLLLYFYSKKLKKVPLWGNVTVAIFCAFVAGIVLFAERQNFAQMGSEGRVVKVLFGGYLWFAFLSTLLREIVKDIEDMDGDAKLGLQTLPIRFGVRKSVNWTLAIGALLLLSLLVFVNWLWQRQEMASAMFTLVGVSLPLVYTLVFLSKSSSKADFTKASFMSKMIMLSGLVLLLVCKFA